MERSRNESSFTKMELHCKHVTSDLNIPPKLLLITLSISDVEIELLENLAAIRDDFRGLLVTEDALLDELGVFSSS
jgi:hypothetical protein